jgi:hypothetical protein
MGDSNSGPIQKSLSNPMILRSVAFRVPPRGNLRHVHNRADPLLYGRLGEKGGGLQNAGYLNGIDKISARDSLQGFAYRLKVGQVALDNFCALRA